MLSRLPVELSQMLFEGLQLKSSVDTPKAKRILHQASLDLTRERIARTRHQLHDLNSSITSTQTQLSLRLKPDDLDKVQAFNDYTSRKTFQSTKLKQINKFDRLYSRTPTQANQQPSTEATKDTVINLSRHQLTQAEHKVLSLGLNFAVAPKKIPFSDIVQQVEPKLRFLSKEAANAIRLKVTNALSDAKPPKQNLSKQERSAIRDLRRNQAIHILQADKGNATVIMDQDAYDDKIEEILQDKDTYSKLNRDPTQANERKINQQLLTLHRSDALPKALYFQLRSSSAKSPILFGQPKIHKPNTPLRPIISTRGSPCYNTARHLANILQPLVGQTQHHVTNSKHFIDVISKTKIRPSDTLVSFDVVCLFTSVPVDQACDIIKQRLITDSDLASRTNLTPDQIHDLLLTCLNSNSFKWRNNYYKQLQGAAMGSPLSPIIANIFMEHFEHQALKTADKPPSLWLRYVDGTFVIWPHSTPDLHQFLNHLNNQHPSIKFTMETQRDNSIPFLDVLITKTPSGFPSHQVYRKPTHTDRYLNFRSHHHPSIHQSVADTLVRRAHQLSDKAHLHQELKHVTNALTTSTTTPEEGSRLTHPATNPAPTAPKTHPKPRVYKIPCDCGKVYIGETGRDFDTRFKEHKTHHRRSDWDRSAIVKHAQHENHRIEWERSHLITNIRHWNTRRVREAIEIHQHNTVPQDPGLHINSIWHQILRHHQTSNQSTNNQPSTVTPPSPPTQHSSLIASPTQPGTPPTHTPLPPTPRYNLRRRPNTSSVHQATHSLPPKLTRRVRRPTRTERHH
ncbi:uncharacterized protein LOC121431166 [Lytechinus variegatus]|uniref:uncharacterized protein LOC121431166 n=1 Tax=Lytechinus variegatus TaxID=7654 RepID=UPI001BB26311|nr:uncharacterized protein LOC121431166 [Lytechinus variegatus]